MTVCALALGWLGWQVLIQDRAMETQRRQEQVENAADRAVAAIERAFAASGVDITVADDRVRVAPAGKLAYIPGDDRPAVPPAIFAEAEALEFAAHNPAAAAAAYRRLAASGPDEVRAGALLRLARALRSQRDWQQALDTYAALDSKFPDIDIAGMPAGLVARAAICSVMRGRDDPAIGRCTAALFTDLTDGKWPVTRPVLETYLAELKSAAPNLSLPSDWPDRMALARSAEYAAAQPSNGRAGLLVDGRTVAISWERQGGSWHARLVAPATWDSVWNHLAQDRHIALRVLDDNGRVIHTTGSPHGPSVYRAAAITGLPWSLSAAPARDEALSVSFTARRRLLIAGLAVFTAILLLGTLLIGRAISRELAVARMQSDFVAAVSHEFRTPLTSLRQLMEILASGRIAGEHDRQRSYELMIGQTERLRRLVESLLDLGRMQARQYKFRCDPIDAGDWTRSVAEEFQETVRGRGYLVEFSPPSQSAWLQGDREALGGALWNLLDNAVKYSPDDKKVLVEMQAANGSVAVTVRDHGCGIPREDLKRVFARFYRGANARKYGASGTGIGLAIVKEIVEAHGGTVSARSEPGQGSEFTMVLPCRES